MSTETIVGESFVLGSPFTPREMRKARLGSTRNSRAGTIRDIQTKYDGDTKADDIVLAAKLNGPLSMYDKVIKIPMIISPSESGHRIGKRFPSTVFLCISGLCSVDVLYFAARISAARVSCCFRTAKESLIPLLMLASSTSGEKTAWNIRLTYLCSF